MLLYHPKWESSEILLEQCYWLLHGTETPPDSAFALSYLVFHLITLSSYVLPVLWAVGELGVCPCCNWNVKSHQCFMIGSDWLSFNQSPQKARNHFSKSVYSSLTENRFLFQKPEGTLCFSHFCHKLQLAYIPSAVPRNRVRPVLTSQTSSGTDCLFCMLKCLLLLRACANWNF